MLFPETRHLNAEKCKKSLKRSLILSFQRSKVGGQGKFRKTMPLKCPYQMEQAIS